MSLQITGWPGLNDRKNYIATDEESPSDRKPWYQCDFCRNQKKEKKERKKEERLWEIWKENCQLYLIRDRYRLQQRRLRSRWNYANSSPSACRWTIYKQWRKTRRADSPNNRTNVMKHGSSIDINVVATIEYDRETQSRSHPIKERNVESLVPSFVPSVLTRNYQRQRTPTGRGGWV